MREGNVMGFDKVKIKQICLMILYIAAVVLALIYSERLYKGLKLAIQIMGPFIIGASIAFILNIPMNMIEDCILKKWRGKSARLLKRPVSILLSVLFVLGILALVIGAIVPQLRITITTLGDKIPPFLDEVILWLENMVMDYPQLAEQIAKLERFEFDWNAVTNTVGGFLTNGVGNVVTSTVNMASTLIGGVAKAFIACIFAIYVLAQKEKLQNQAQRILNAYAPEKFRRGVLEVVRRLYVNLTNFICGQCLEAVILGTLFIIAMSIFRMPYAVMIGTLIAFTALIPIVGAFIGCAVGAFMILIENPAQALVFVIMFLILQQIEGNLIYPRVVGNSVGLPSMWVLVSVSVGGSLCGVAGMLVFIPLMSTFYSLLRDDVNRRNNKSRGNVKRKTYYQQRNSRSKENNSKNCKKR